MDLSTSKYWKYAGCFSSEPILVALAPTSLLMLSGRASGQVTIYITVAHYLYSLPLTLNNEKLSREIASWGLWQMVSRNEIGVR